jgi:ATP-binding cassette subfamily B protein
VKDIARIIRYSWSLKRYYLVTMAFTVAISLLNQVDPFIFKGVVDGLVKHGQGQAVPVSLFVISVALIAFVNLSTAIMSNISGYIGDVLGVKLNRLLSERYFEHLLQLPLAYYDGQQAGKITSRLDRSIGTISQLVQSFANNFIGFILTSVITIAIMAYYAWPIAILLAALFPFYIWLTMLSSEGWQEKQGPINENTDKIKGRFVESIGQIRVVKSFAQELNEHRYMSGRFALILKATMGQSREWHWYDVARRTGLAVVFVGIYAYIIWQTWLGHYSLGTFTLLVQLATQAQFPLFASSFIVDNIQRAQAGSKDYFEVMDTTPTIVDRIDALPLTITNGGIRFEQVSFTYDGNNQVLNNLSFNVEPNTRIAFVGESGEGKTTITNILLRFYDASSGVISIDETDISSVSQTSLREQIGVVFQEPALFSGTIYENIAYGSANATKLQVEVAAKAANASTFISKLASGYETEIGERGVKLSGGQKQRIAIARAILKDAPILILDEATSSLDSKAEHEVQEALNELMKNRTTLIIAHRLSTIAGVDKIIGLSGGQISEQGTPAELSHAGGIYAELLALQSPTKANKAKLKRYDIAR